MAGWRGARRATQRSLRLLLAGSQCSACLEARHLGGFGGDARRVGSKLDSRQCPLQLGRRPGDLFGLSSGSLEAAVQAVDLAQPCSRRLLHGHLVRGARHRCTIGLFGSVLCGAQLAAIPDLRVAIAPLAYLGQLALDVAQPFLVRNRGLRQPLGLGAARIDRAARWCAGARRGEPVTSTSASSVSRRRRRRLPDGWVTSVARVIWRGRWYDRGGGNRAQPAPRGLTLLAIDPNQEFLVQPVDASWLQCNIECQEACPVGTNCRGYLNLAAEGKFEEGYVLSREPNPVAAMCAYVCSAPCERACRRGDIDRPLAIRAMKRFLVEWHQASGIPDDMPPITPRDTRVAVVGAGPAGIAVARELATAGHQVTVFDELPYGGGTMLIGVPAFRLPREAIEMDLKLVERLGVRFRYGIRIGRDISFEQLMEDYDAVAICAGAMNAVPLDVPGSDLEGIQYGVDYMKKANLGEPMTVGNDVVVIGGGYTAMDCSRTSLRYGAQNVTIAYRRTRSELVVDEEELGETEREGVRMEFLVSPVELLGDDNGNLRRGEVRPQPPRRARRHRPPRARADRGQRVRDRGRHRHPGCQPGRRQHLPAGRFDLRDQSRSRARRSRARTPPTCAVCSRVATSSPVRRP